MDYILLAIFILLSGYYSGLEMGIYCLNRVRLQHRVDRGWRTARILVRHLKKPQVLLCTILVGNNIVNFVASAVFTRLLENRTALVQTELFTTIILSPILAGLCRSYTQESISSKIRQASLYPCSYTGYIS